jgi:hypothetical protein
LIFVSNSPFWYVDAGMRFVLGEDWNHEWDAVITSKFYELWKLVVFDAMPNGIAFGNAFVFFAINQNAYFVHPSYLVMICEALENQISTPTTSVHFEKYAKKHNVCSSRELIVLKKEKYIAKDVSRS